MTAAEAGGILAEAGIWSKRMTFRRDEYRVVSREWLHGPFASLLREIVERCGVARGGWPERQAGLVRLAAALGNFKEPSGIGECAFLNTDGEQAWVAVVILNEEGERRAVFWDPETEKEIVLKAAESASARIDF